MGVASEAGLQALERDGLAIEGIAPFRADDKPRAAWPSGLPHLELIAAGARALEKATLWPFVVTVTYRQAGQVSTLRTVVQRAASNPPHGDDVLPADAEFMRADVLPAMRFADMAVGLRSRYAAEYKAFLMWRKGRAIGKSVDALVPWVEYDPVMIDAEVYRWTRGESAVTA